MFGDNMPLGSKESIVDAKGRIVLPTFTNAEDKDEIAIVYDEEKRNIELYLLLSLKTRILEMDKRRGNTCDDLERQYLFDELDRITDLIIDTTKVDKQRRLLLPKLVRQKEEIDSESTVLLTGKYLNGNSFIKIKKYLNRV